MRDRMAIEVSKELIEIEPFIGSGEMT